MLKQTPHRPPSTTRRTGYVFAIVLNAAMLYAIHSWPGWQQVPFLSPETEQVLGWVTATLIAAVGVNLVYVLADPPWMKSLGDLIVTGIGFLAIIRVWRVFPFEFGSTSFDWALLVRIALAIGFFGSIAAMIVQLFMLVANVSRVRH